MTYIFDHTKRMGPQRKVVTDRGTEYEPDIEDVARRRAQVERREAERREIERQRRAAQNQSRPTSRFGEMDTSTTTDTGRLAFNRDRFMQAPGLIRFDWSDQGYDRTPEERAETDRAVEELIRSHRSRTIQRPPPMQGPIIGNTGAQIQRLTNQRQPNRGPTFYDRVYAILSVHPNHVDEVFAIRDAELLDSSFVHNTIRQVQRDLGQNIPDDWFI